MAIMIGGLVLMHAAIPARAYACICVCAVYPETPTRAQLKADVAHNVKEAVAVFSGRVIGVDRSTVRFRVERSWKGKLGRVIELSLSLSTCDYLFTGGARYIVFASGKSVKTMHAGQCGGTQPLKQAADIIGDLDELSRGKSR